MHLDLNIVGAGNVRLRENKLLHFKVDAEIYILEGWITLMSLSG